MEIRVPTTIDFLISEPFFWFSKSYDRKKYVKQNIQSRETGVYCLWWKDLAALPNSYQISLPAGRTRGVINTTIIPKPLLVTKYFPLYVGKGSIRNRLLSHIDPLKAEVRGPYWWMKTVFPNSDTSTLIQDQVGFSYINIMSSTEQIYTENLAIGLLTPLFNFRYPA